MDHDPSVSYSRRNLEIVRTDEFDQWIRKLNDNDGRRRILSRIDRLANGNPGDVKAVGRGVSELRLTYGPGYRVYYLQADEILILLICGGDKASQKNDINKAHELAERWLIDTKANRRDTQNGRAGDVQEVRRRGLPHGPR